MAYCVHCGAQIPDGVGICPYCGRLQQNAPANGAQNAPVYGGYDAYAQQQSFQAKKDLATAKTLGIVSIVCGVIGSFLVISWICGIIGIIKSKAAMAYAQQTADFKMFDDAKTAKLFNVIGLSISGVIFALVIITVLLAVFVFAVFD